MLTLKRASKHRAGGPWSEDDYDVFDGDRHVGRILWTSCCCSVVCQMDDVDIRMKTYTIVVQVGSDRHEISIMQGNAT